MEELNRLKKSSQRSAIISLIGVLIFISSLVYSSYNLSITTAKLNSTTKLLKREGERIDSLKQEESELNEYLINLLNSTQTNQGNPKKQSAKINWDIIKSTVTRLPSGRRKLAITIALLTTWKEIPFKFGINKPTEGYDATGYIKYILQQVGITVEQKTNEKLSQALMRVFKKVDSPLPGDLVFYQERNKDKIGNFGLIYLCPGNKNGQGVAIGTLDTTDPLNIYDTGEVLNPHAFLGYYRVAY